MRNAFVPRREKVIQKGGFNFKHLGGDVTIEAGGDVVAGDQTKEVKTEYNVDVYVNRIQKELDKEKPSMSKIEKILKEVTENAPELVDTVLSIVENPIKALGYVVRFVGERIFIQKSYNVEA